MTIFKIRHKKLKSNDGTCLASLKDGLCGDSTVITHPCSDISFWVGKGKQARICIAKDSRLELLILYFYSLSRCSSRHRAHTSQAPYLVSPARLNQVLILLASPLWDFDIDPGGMRQGVSGERSQIALLMVLCRPVLTCSFWFDAS